MQFSHYEVQDILSKIDFSIFDRENFSSFFIEDEYFGSLECDKVCNNGIHIKYGASKLVFIPNDYNFVIKIPFIGTFDEDEFKDFSRAFYPLTKGCGYDYCKSEAEYYQLAKKEGFSDFFCETQYFTTRDNISIYISEKAKDNGDSFKNKVTAAELDIVKDTAKRYKINCINIYLLKILLQYHCPERVKQLYNFLAVNNISDLHNENFGIRERDNMPVIIDYSDFWD